MTKTIAIVGNFFVPGMGSLYIQKHSQAVWQLLIWGFGVFIMMLGFVGLLGLFLCFLGFVWGLVTAFSYTDQTDTEA